MITSPTGVLIPKSLSGIDPLISIDDTKSSLYHFTSWTTTMVVPRGSVACDVLVLVPLSSPVVADAFGTAASGATSGAYLGTAMVATLGTLIASIVSGIEIV